MKQIFKYILLVSLVAFITSCTKNNDEAQPVNPAPVISNLVYNPHVVTINLSTPTFFVTGTIDFKNVTKGVSVLRLTNSAGADITMDLTDLYSGATGQITGAFEFAMPPDPVTHTFEIWIVDGNGRSSNKLSGSVQFIK